LCQRSVYPNSSNATAREHEEEDDSTSTSNALNNNLPSVVAQSRSICKLPYLMGSAPICYGLPVYIQ
jgi:hypothetical protein